MFFARIPQILKDLHELVSNTINKAESKGVREDLKTLIALTTHELFLDNKKALKIRTFEALDD